MREACFTCLVQTLHCDDDDDYDDQWHYSPDRALASLTGFMIVL
jgi:hypothetical protein